MHFFKRKYYQLKVNYLNQFGTDKQFVKAAYKLKNDKPLNLNKPIEFTEKLQWLNFYKYSEDYKMYVDKYEVRSYIEKKLGKGYLNEIIGVYDAVEDLDFKNFPNQFALKCTHGSGYNVIVKDKSATDLAVVKQQLKSFMSRNYYNKYRERIYKHVQPRILVEKYLDQLESDYIIDYKFFCVNGKPKFIYVKTFYDGAYRNCYYNLNWEKICPDLIHKNYLNKDIPKPENLNEMIAVAEKLSSEFYFVRVDLYSIKNKIYFGELTFFHLAGLQRLTVDRLNKELGDLIPISA